MGCCISCYTHDRAIHYEDLRASLKTGDLVLFSGIGHISCPIQGCTHSPWSHVGMVVRCADYGEADDNLYLWHSNGEIAKNTQDVLTGREKKGPQLNPLADFIRGYDGAVVIRQISAPPQIKVHGECSDRLKEFMEKHAPKDYEQSMGELANTMCEEPFGFVWGMWGNMCWKRTGDDSFFCSELIARTYQMMGYLSTKRAANMYTPSDFSSSGIKFLRLGFYLQREQLVLV